jgi:predicted PhzF superfamily epimerase YddE/YHI9
MRIFQVDAFTTELFSGNPAGVCLVEDDRDDAWMQAVAAEMNLPETAFLSPGEDGWHLRWFTPTVEVDLCGHATLAASHILWEAGEADPGDRLRFQTRSGVLTARPSDRGILLDFPADPPTAVPPPDGLVAAIGAPAVWSGRGRVFWILELADEGAVRGLRPDLGALGRACDTGVVVTAGGDGGDRDFVSRMFAPSMGIDEDQVTGATHCILSPYWTDRLGRTDLVGYQASSRGGTVGVRLVGDRVELGGRAVTFLRGSID